jgi:hypothetical protein
MKTSSKVMELINQIRTKEGITHLEALIKYPNLAELLENEQHSDKQEIVEQKQENRQLLHD